MNDSEYVGVGKGGKVGKQVARERAEEEEGGGKWCNERERGQG